MKVSDAILLTRSLTSSTSLMIDHLPMVKTAMIPPHLALRHSTNRNLCPGKCSSSFAARWPILPLRNEADLSQWHQYDVSSSGQPSHYVPCPSPRARRAAAVQPQRQVAIAKKHHLRRMGPCLRRPTLLRSTNKLIAEVEILWRRMH